MTAGRAPTRPPSRFRWELSRLFDLRPGEARLVALLSFTGFALITSLYLLKSVAKALFLDHHPAEDFRWVYLATGFVGAAVGIAYSRLARRVALVPLVNTMLIGLLVVLIGFRVLLGLGEQLGSLTFLLSLFQQVFSVLSVALFYLSLNHLLEPRQARRLLGLIGAGSIMGGIAGGYLAKLVADTLGTEYVLWGAVVLLAAGIAALDFVFWRAPRIGRPRPERRRRRENALQLVLGNAYLQKLVVLIGLVTLCAALCDFQFNWAIDTYVEKGDARTAFIGFWLSTLSALSLPCQLLLMGPILRRFGVGPALMTLPVFILACGGGMFALPGLVFGTALKVGDGALRFSLNRSAVELLYLPLPLWLKDRTKVFIDTSLDRFAKSGAGFLLICLVDGLGWGIRAVSGLTAGLALFWIAWALALRNSYLDAFREALRRGSLEPAAARDSFTEPGLLSPLVEGLDSSSPEVVRRSLDLLLDAQQPRLEGALPRLVELARSEDRDLAVPALVLAGRAGGEAVVEVADRRLESEDVDVAVAAADALFLAGGGEPQAFLERLAARGERAEFLGAAALLGRGQDLPDSLVDRVLADRSEAAAEARRRLARALSRRQLPKRRELIRRLMADPVPRVAVAALRGAGDLGDLDLVPFLVTALRVSATRGAAREGLRRLGPRVLPLLQEYVGNERVEHDVRRRLPRAIARIGGPNALAILAQALDEDDPRLRDQVLRVLARLDDDVPHLQLQAELVESELRDECHALARLIALVATPGAGGPARRLFERAVREAIARARVRAFRLLGLRGARDDWEHALAGLNSADARLRATAVEFADGSLPERLRHLVVPLVDDIAASEALNRVGRHIDIQPLEPGQAYAIAAASADRWLAACALAAAAEEGRREVLEIAGRRRDDPDRWVREAARAAQEDLAGHPA